MKREFKGIWIPAEIWCNSDLSWVEKVMLREIDSLNDERNGGCYASNGYFSEFFGLSKSRVSEIIGSLVRKKYVSTYLVKHTDSGEIRTKRLLRTTGKGLRKTEPPYSESRKSYSEKRKGYSGNGEYNNTDNNINRSAPAPSMSPEQAEKSLQDLSDILSGKRKFRREETGGPRGPEGSPGDSGPQVA